MDLWRAVSMEWVCWWARVYFKDHIFMFQFQLNCHFCELFSISWPFYVSWAKNHLQESWHHKKWTIWICRLCENKNGDDKRKKYYFLRFDKIEKIVFRSTACAALKQDQWPHIGLCFEYVHLCVHSRQFTWKCLFKRSRGLRARDRIIWINIFQPRNTKNLIFYHLLYFVIQMTELSSSERVGTHFTCDFLVNK